MFRTEISIPKSNIKIGLKDKVLTLGSCFSDTIGQTLSDYKFPISSNPLGTVFNPLSIFKLIEKAILKAYVKENELINHQGIYYHFDFHSDLSDPSPEKLTTLINQKLEDVHDFLAGSNWLIITLGTSFIYELKSDGRVVSNCHKVPASEFEKKLLSTKTIIAGFDTIYNRLHEFNPALNILLTVSPVRHIKDTIEMNQVSKSTLRLATHFLKESYEKVGYFPSYEIMMDDLRDYRFYEKDLLHPSDLAVEYIWEKFQNTYLDDETIDFINKWKKLKQGLGHKPFHPKSKKHQEFLENTLLSLRGLSSEVDVSEEIIWVERQLGK